MDPETWHLAAWSFWRDVSEGEREITLEELTGAADRWDDADLSAVYQCLMDFIDRRMASNMNQ